MATKVTAQVEAITPERAKELLQYNTHNRSKKDSRIERYAEIMRRGEWQVNGEAIKIADDGTILDGQNRLFAVIESGVTIQALVVRNLPRVAQETMDQGMNRNIADVLTLRGEHNVSNLGALLGALYRWDHYKPSAAFKPGSYATTIGMQLEYLDRHPELRDVITPISTIAKKLHVPVRVVGVAYVKFHEASQDYADYFFDCLVSGANLDQNDPILKLRNWITKINSSLGRKTDPTFILGMFIKVWNFTVQGKTVQQLTLRLLGQGAEQFPEVLIPAQEAA